MLYLVFHTRFVAVHFIKQLKNQEAVENKSVKFSCSVEPTHARVRWFIGINEVTESSKFRLTENEGERYLWIRNLTPQDAGSVCCMAGNTETKADLTVKGKDNRFYY